MELQLLIVIAVALCAGTLPGLSLGQLKEGGHCFFRDGTLGVCRKSVDCLEMNDMRKVNREHVRRCSRFEPIYCCKRNNTRMPHAARRYVPKAGSGLSDRQVLPSVPVLANGKRQPVNTMHEHRNHKIRQERRGENESPWVHANGNQDNKSCTTDNREQGICTNAFECPALRNGPHKSAECSNGQAASLVCCPRASISAGSVTQTALRSATSRTTRDSSQAGLKSAAKCQEYSKYLIQKVRSMIPLVNSGFVNESLCMARKHAPNQKPLAAAEHAIPKEYPHMAALGYGRVTHIEWLCSGSLISEEFILTTARCLHSPKKGKVSWVHLGDLGVKNNKDPAHDNIKVARTFPHEQADIALVKTEKNVDFYTTIRPVCLYSKQGNPKEYTFATATGWGMYDWESKPPSTDLRKKDFNFENCDERKRIQGVSEHTHVCVSNPDVDDTSACVVDSGSPLQIVLDEPNCMNSIVALASFGKDACTDNGNIAVYTRVSTYIDWIEDIVWPDE